MINKKGFTLMEILFVLLVIALIMSFALPMFRSVRYDVRNSRAQTALKKLAEARRSYYQYSRGTDIAVSSFTGASAKGLSDPSTCTNPAAIGAPGANVGAVTVGQLFACGFLNWRDFDKLPYEFYICNLNSWTVDGPCRGLAGTTYADYGPVIVGAVGTANAGKKYKYDSTVADPYRMFLLQDGIVRDNSK